MEAETEQQALNATGAQLTDDELDQSELEDLDDTDGQDARHEREGSVYLPTAEEIRAACLEIQAGWTPLDRENRNAYRVGPIEYDRSLKPGRIFGPHA